MKRLFVIIALVPVILASCSLLSLFNHASTDLYRQVASTTPVFGKDGDPRLLAPKGSRAFADGFGNTLYQVYYTMRSFDPAVDDGFIDRANLYRLVYDVETIFEGTSWLATRIDSGTVRSPFDKIAAADYYEFGGADEDSSVVYNKTGNETEGMVSMRWTEASMPNKDDIGVTSFKTNSGTGELSVDFAYSVDYDTSTPAREYAIRAAIEGNLIAHEFQFTYKIDSYNIVAKGISEGAGNWMLFKYRNDAAFSDTYLAVPAGADYAWFEENGEADATSNPDDLPAAVAEYKDWVVAQPYFANGDLITSSEDFAGGTWKIQW